MSSDFNPLPDANEDDLLLLVGLNIARTRADAGRLIKRHPDKPVTWLIATYKRKRHRKTRLALARDRFIRLFQK